MHRTVREEVLDEVVERFRRCAEAAASAAAAEEEEEEAEGDVAITEEDEDNRACVVQLDCGGLQAPRTAHHIRMRPAVIRSSAKLVLHDRLVGVPLDGPPLPWRFCPERRRGKRAATQGAHMVISSPLVLTVSSVSVCATPQERSFCHCARLVWSQPMGPLQRPQGRRSPCYGGAGLHGIAAAHGVIGQ